jgi:hypothetical protein
MNKLFGAAAVAAALALASPASAAYIFNVGELGGAPVNLTGATGVNTGYGSVGGQNVTFTSTNLMDLVTGAATITAEPLTNLGVDFSGGESAVGWNVEIPGGRAPAGGYSMAVSVNGGSTIGVDYFVVNQMAPPQKYNITTTDGSLIDNLDFTFNPGVDGTKQFRLTAGQGTGAVPEPATWAMMLMGFFGLGALVRRQKGVAVAA